jgi:hypothetical protein
VVWVKQLRLGCRRSQRLLVVVRGVHIVEQKGWVVGTVVLAVRTADVLGRVVHTVAVLDGFATAVLAPAAVVSVREVSFWPAIVARHHPHLHP